jgi:aconitate hydratase
MTSQDPFGARQTLDTNGGKVEMYRLDALEREGAAQLDKIPMTVKILLENVLRLAGGPYATEDDVNFLSMWGQKPLEDREFAFSPSRVLLQDFTGVPAVVDLAAMRSAIARSGGKASKVDPLVPVDLVIDHSVQVDVFGNARAYQVNVEREYERNHERYSLLRWAQQAFHGFRVVPPGMGIVHQVNLEHLAKVVQTLDQDGSTVALPDTLVGTDSHTTMINGLGVLGWGVGGIEAEAAMLGQPLPMLTPKVVGFRFTGSLELGVTATDLVLTVTEMLRKHGVVGKLVEFYGEGLSSLSVADRATIGNMSPEYGATCGYFPIDDQSLEYLKFTGRDEETIDLVERYAKEQGLYRTDGMPAPEFTESLELDLSSVEPSVAGPRRPQDRVPLGDVWASYKDVYNEYLEKKTDEVPVELEDGETRLGNGDVVIAAITSCTNTSNPSVMLAAGLLAQKARAKGLRQKPWVKTSLAPGSRVVTDYLERSGLADELDGLGFQTVGYGCTTCIGNSGPLPDAVAAAIDENDLAVVSVLSGNRNFEGRIHPQVRASYLASPPLVVAFALAGTANIDMTKEPIGEGTDGPVYLKDIWPSQDEINEAMKSVQAESFRREYARVFEGDDNWRSLPSPTGELFDWDPDSTYVREVTFFEDIDRPPADPEDVNAARVLAFVADSVTTDHISPAGSIAKGSPASKYLEEHGVGVRDYNSYGSRRGNHEVMVRGTFANIRLRNKLADREGGWTTHIPSGEEVTIYDAAMKYADEGTPLIIIAGKEYGSGSSRDWAAKGPRLQGVRAVIAESFERIHRSNLVGMGVLPLQFHPGENAESHGLTGKETFEITGVAEDLQPHKDLTVRATSDDGDTKEFTVECRIDSEVELQYYRNGGVLNFVLRRMLTEN